MSNCVVTVLVLAVPVTLIPTKVQPHTAAAPSLFGGAIQTLESFSRLQGAEMPRPSSAHHLLTQNFPSYSAENGVLARRPRRRLQFRELEPLGATSDLPESRSWARAICPSLRLLACRPAVSAPNHVSLWT